MRGEGRCLYWGGRIAGARRRSPIHNLEAAVRAGDRDRDTAVVAVAVAAVGVSDCHLTH